MSLIDIAVLIFSCIGYICLLTSIVNVFRSLLTMIANNEFSVDFWVGSVWILGCICVVATSWEYYFGMLGWR